MKRHKEVNNGGQCTILVNDFYEICKQLNHCKMCNTNPHCGWCAGRNMCLPGGKQGSVCPNSSSGCPSNEWIFQSEFCGPSDKGPLGALGGGDLYMAGELTNIDRRARVMVNPDYAYPNIPISGLNIHNYNRK